MDFGTAVSTCLRKYADFTGRAQRSEFWWFQLFGVMAGIAARIVDHALHLGFVNGLVTLALFVPGIAAGARRLHDTDRTGWWQLLFLVPLVGWIMLLIFEAERGNLGRNRYG